MKKNVKYKTHPIYKALFCLLFIVTVSAVVFAWAMFAYAETKADECKRKIDGCEYEAYLSFYENLIGLTTSERNETYFSQLAGEALGRYIMFSELHADLDALYELLVSGEVDKTQAEELLTVIESATDADAAVLSAAAVANGWESGGVRSSERSSGGWRWLSAQPEVKKLNAEKLAERYIGGGGDVDAVESHTFPLVYAYSNGNAYAEVTRAGGRLIRLCKFPLGTATLRSEAECVASAERFLREVKLTDVSLVSRNTDGEAVKCVFSTDEKAAATVCVTVALRGATVIYFDAYEYYKWR